MSGNPFKPAEAVAPKVKALIYGPSGIGKTYLALTAPGRVAVIDTEGGTAFYAGRTGLSDFDVLPTKTFHDVTEAVAYLKAHPDVYKTLVIDPVTVLYETLQDAAQVKRADKRHDPDADLEMLDWQRIKRAYKSLMTELVNLPLHVIVTAREKDETERRGGEQVKVGVRPDTEKSTPYYFDAIVRLALREGKRVGLVEKDRTGTLPADVQAPTFEKLFGKAIKAGDGATAERQVASDAEAAEADARTTFSDGLPSTPDGGLIGRVATQGTQDYQLREAPNGGATLPFRVKEGRSSVIVLAHDDLARALAQFDLLGQRVTVWGRFSTENVPGKPVQFDVLHLGRIQTPEFTLPAENMGEAPSEPLFSDEEQARLDAAVAGAA